MTLFFWQNILSQIQVPYIIGLSKIDNVKVILVVQELLDDSRQILGWESLKEKVKTTEINLLISPAKSEIKEIFKSSTANSHHFFSGIRSYSLINYAFKQSLNYGVKRYLVVEGPQHYKKPKFLHFIKTALLEYHYFKHINKIYAIGSHALVWYPHWGFGKNQIIPFTYVVESCENRIKSKPTETLKLVYVGNLIKRKGVDKLINTLKFIKAEYQLDIIGDGEERKNLEALVELNDLSEKVKFLGVQKSSVIRNSYSNYDVHILPSYHDGWGAVVNEALMAGLFVICSDKCGAKDLIHHKKNGLVFSHDKKKDLLNSLYFCIENVKLIRSKKKEIKKWSRCIEPETIAQYFLNSMQSYEEIKPPWKKELI